MKDSLGRGLWTFAFQEELEIPKSIAKDIAHQEDRWCPVSTLFLTYYKKLRQTNDYFTGLKNRDLWEKIQKNLEIMDDSHDYITWPLAVYLLKKHTHQIKDPNHFNLEKRSMDYAQEVVDFALNHTHPSHLGFLESVYNQVIELQNECQRLEREDFDNFKSEYFKNPNYIACREKIKLIWKTIPESLTNFKSTVSQKPRI